jgi:16S rRNA (guanine527-N7)-methyltransferase
MMHAELCLLLTAGLEELRLDVAEDQVSQLANLSEQVAEWGQRINLSGHRSAEAVARELVLDAAALLGALPGFDSLADLGSGAGFPGIPIAVLRPRARVVLVEARQRRHHFQRSALRQLELENVKALLGRMESLESEPCDVAVAQAVGPSGDVLAAMGGWAAPTGYRVIPGSTGSRPPEISAGYELEEVAYRVPLGGRLRALWLVRAI